MKVSVRLEPINQIVTNCEIDNFLDYQSEYHKKNITIHNKFIEGSYRIIYTSGFLLIENDYTIKKRVKEYYTIDEDFIQISIAIQGESYVIKENENKKIEEGVIQLAYKPYKETEIEIPAVENFKYVRIFMTKTYFIEILKNEGWVVNDDLYNSVINQAYINFGILKYDLNYSIISIITQIINCDFCSFFAKYHLQNKLRELFFLHHMATKKENLSTINSDINTLNKAKKYLELNYKNPPTIQELSKKVYLNEFKLKKGFKEHFNTTIHQFVINIRIQKAIELLKQDKPINEIAFEVGYKTPSHFIANFKTQMGYTPSKMSKK